MKTLTLIPLLSLTILLGCGEDVGGSRKKATTERSTPNLGGSVAVGSGAHRDRNSAILSSQELANQILRNSLPATVREIPDFDKDDEGNKDSVTLMDTIGRPIFDCGVTTTLTTLQARIADCSAKNPVRSLWSALNGNAGEANWTLVARSGTGQEIWQDLRTGLIWSQVVTSTNWCKASGNAVGKCTIPAGNESFCIGNILLNIPSIKWRLPTRNDFLQADLDGYRFVVPKFGTLWTATIDSESVGRGSAWVYSDAQGTLDSAPLANSHGVRCVGVSP